MTTNRISVNSNGIQSNNSSDSPAISSNGRLVAFVSEASNLVPGDTNGKNDIFLYDTVTKKTSRISVDSTGIQANNHSNSPSLSSDGRYITYSSDASNLVPGDTNGKNDIFLYDTVTKKTSRISVDSTGIQANNHSNSPFLSSDGRYITYSSDASNLVPGDTNLASDIFLYDTVTKKNQSG